MVSQNKLKMLKADWNWNYEPHNWGAKKTNLSHAESSAKLKQEMEIT